MDDESNRLTPAGHLGMKEIGSLTTKSPLGGYEVPLLQFLTVGHWIFLKGVVFGRARHEKLRVIAKIFIGLEHIANTFEQLGLPRELAKKEDMVFEYLLKVSNDGIAYYKNCYKKEPESFLDLWLTSFTPPEVDFHNLNKMKKLVNKKIRLGLALQQADNWLFVGLSFGATFPELTEKIWKREYDKHDPEQWAFARKAGLDLTEKFTPLPLKEMEQQVLTEVSSYVAEYFPDLIDPLNLRL